MAAAGGEVDPVMPNDPSGEGPGTTLVPRWVSGNTNLFATLVACVMVGLALFLIGWLAPVVAPMGLGLFLAALAAPMFTWLEQRGRSPALALTLTIAVVLAIGVGLVSLVLAGAAALTDGIVTYSDDLRSRYPDVSDPTIARSVAGMMARILPPDVLSDVLKAVARILVEVGQSLIFAVVVAALLLLDGRRLSSLAARGIGSEGPVFRETPGIARAAVTYFAVRIRINAVTAWREAPYFTEAERAALALTEAATRIADRPEPVSDELWDEVTRNFDEQELSALLLAIAGINVWNRLNVVTRQVAGAEW